MTSSLPSKLTRIVALCAVLALASCTSDRSDCDPGYGGDPSKAAMFKAGMDNAEVSDPTKEGSLH